MSTRTAYDRALSLDRGGSSALFAVVALAAHCAVGSLLARHARAATNEPPAPPTEVEFVAPPDPPKPVAVPVPEEVREDRVAVPTTAGRPARAAPARAAAVVTAAGAPNDGDPVTFFADASGTAYAQGPSGPATTGAAPTARPPTPSAAPPKKQQTMTPPRLVETNPCRGFFPTHADDDTATVTMLVEVQPNGRVTTALVVAESPLGQGFGVAARTCMLSRRFVAATEDGVEVAAKATVNVHFSR